MGNILLTKTDVKCLYLQGDSKKVFFVIIIPEYKKVLKF